MEKIMDQFEIELQALRSQDEIQFTKPCGLSGYNFIETAGHGYLVVPKNDRNVAVAKRICDCGYKGKLAYYLEEDCELPMFLKAIGYSHKP